MDSGLVSELHLFSLVKSERLVPPYEWPHQQMLESILIIDGSEPLVPQLNAAKRFQDSALAAMREALAAPAPSDRRDLPSAELSIEARDGAGRQLHFLRYFVRPSLERAGEWLISHSRDDRREIDTARVIPEDPLRLAAVLIGISVRYWTAGVGFAELRKARGARVPLSKGHRAQ